MGQRLQKVMCRDGEIRMFEVLPSNFVVVTRHGVRMTGAWAEEREARRFRAGIGGDVVAVPAYQYACGFGPVVLVGEVWVEAPKASEEPVACGFLNV